MTNESTPGTTVLERALLAGINAGIAEFQMNPHRFLLEYDIQSMLFSYLRQIVRRTIEVPRLCEPDKPPYAIDLIHSEYNFPHANNANIDLVCLDPDRVENRQFEEKDAPDGEDVYIYTLPLLLALELKYDEMLKPKSIKEYSDAFDKIEGMCVPAVFRLVLGFYQSNDKADSFCKKLTQKGHCVEKCSQLPGLDGIFLIAPCAINGVRLARPIGRDTV